MGLRAGWALDITTRDKDGREWDFNQLEMRNRAVRRDLQDKPLLFIGSPMCTAFSQMNNMNYHKMDPAEVQRRMEYGRRHLEFCTQLYNIQWEAGRYFLHEHPAGASSWSEKCIQKLLNKHGVMRVNGDQCRYGLVATDNGYTGPARKSTGFMTNSPCIAKSLSKRCENTAHKKMQEHVPLTDGRAKAAQVYPPALYKAICQGLRQQMIVDEKGQFLLAQVDNNASGGELMKVAKEFQSQYKTVEEDNQEELEEAWDDVLGACLEPKAVRAARMEEVEYIHKVNLYTKVPVTECRAKTGKSPISVRWIDMNKGDTEKPDYRSRMVAREINIHKREDLFAATPPLEALKLILSMTASGNKGEILMVNDVSRAFFHAKATRDVYVQLPDEDKAAGEEGMCGKLNYSMYGTRDAAQNWQEEFSQQLVSNGFTRGVASPCVFHHESRGIRTLVHGDDYVIVGMPRQLQWLEERLKSKYQIKTQLLGPGGDHLRELRIFNRIVTWSGTRGLTYEADPRHVEIVVEQLKLVEANTVTTPGTREEGTTQHNAQEVLNDEETSKYRALVARCNYLSPDRPDISYAVQELARHMSAPTEGNWAQLKRLGRYLKGRPRLQQQFQWQPILGVLRTYSDADWAGCKDTRKSITGGCITFGKHIVKGWSKTQSLVALSSGESELYATLKAAAETLGMLSLLKDLGWRVTGEIWGDASTALGIINRRGLCKARHIDTGLLWIQQTAAEKRLRFNKVLGKNNLADLYTKHLDATTMGKHTRAMAYEFAEGRAREAPKLHLILSDDEDLCQCVKEICSALNANKSMTRNNKRSLMTCSSMNILGQLTGSGRQVLQGTNWQVQGFNGSNAAQPDQPWGSTLTFQPSAGVSWVLGLRHGVAMHPRGRHLRGDRTLPFTWESQHWPVNSSHNSNIHNHTTTTTTQLRRGNRSIKKICRKNVSTGWSSDKEPWSRRSSSKPGKAYHFVFKYHHNGWMQHSGSSTDRRSTYGKHY